MKMRREKEGGMEPREECRVNESWKNGANKCVGLTSLKMPVLACCSLPLSQENFEKAI